jgi:hypothetical protein
VAILNFQNKTENFTVYYEAVNKAVALTGEVACFLQEDVTTNNLEETCPRGGAVGRKIAVV